MKFHPLAVAALLLAYEDNATDSFVLPFNGQPKRHGKILSKLSTLSMIPPPSTTPQNDWYNRELEQAKAQQLQLEAEAQGRWDEAFAFQVQTETQPSFGSGGGHTAQMAEATLGKLRPVGMRCSHSKRNWIKNILGLKRNATILRGKQQNTRIKICFVQLQTAFLSSKKGGSVVAS